MKLGRLFLVLSLVYFLSINIAFAQELKYSFGPVCKNDKVICRDSNEVPVCLTINNKVHIEKAVVNGEIVNQFQPTCSGYDDSSLPTCIDITEEEQLAKNVVVGCIEIPKCKTNENNNQLVAVCSDGKMPKCLGDDSEPSCDIKVEAGLPHLYSACEKGIAVCDYTWEAKAF